MNGRFSIFVRTLSSTVAATALLLVSVSVMGQAQSSAGKSTPWGDPDLQGVWTSDGVMGVPFERRKAEADLTPQEVEYERRRLEIDDQVDPGGSNVVWNERELGRIIERPTSLVIDPPDGRVPITTEMKDIVFNIERHAHRYGIGLTTYADLDLWDRCFTKGFPTVMMPLGYSNMYQIVQTPDHVAIYYEVIHDVRIIPLDGRPPLDQGVRQMWGDSRGRWEGDTLVVDVTNFSDKTFGTQQAIGGFLGGGKDMSVVERFRLIDDNVIEYQATVTDPRSFTRPWTMGVPLVRDDFPVYEYACHEGNYGLTNILTAALVQYEQDGGKK